MPIFLSYRHRRPLLLLALFLLLAAVLPPSAGARRSDQVRLMRVYAPDAAAARALLESGVDLIAARDGDYLFALLDGQQRQRMQHAGWHVQPLTQWQAPDIQNIAGYRSVAAIEARLAEMAAAYPSIAQLIDYGDTWERSQDPAAGHDLLAMRLRAPGIDGPRPVFFLLAAVHAREMVTSEIALRLIEELLASYGQDPDITWMLQEYEFVIVPLANPDGRLIVEQGFLQRKNTNDSAVASCAAPPENIVSNHSGVDLNRNSSFMWGSIDTPTQSPCNQTYPGTGPASEPEIQAFEALAAALFPPLAPEMRPANGMPAPEDTAGIFISLHSFGDMILWPWGHTEALAPNAPALERLGKQLAELAGFVALPSHQLYPSSGTNDEWLYAELGRAAFTFEIGALTGRCGGFVPPASCLDEDAMLWQRSRAALLHAARLTRAPYQLSAGPQIYDAVAEVKQGTLIVQASIDGGTVPVAGAWLTFDRSAAIAGAGYSMQAYDGAFDSPREQVQLALPVADLPDISSALLLIEGWNNDQQSGPPQALRVRTINPIHWLPLVQRP